MLKHRTHDNRYRLTNLTIIGSMGTMANLMTDANYKVTGITCNYKSFQVRIFRE